MKKHCKIVAFLTALLLCLTPLFGSVLTVRAEGPVTYYVKYQADIAEWRYQTGSAWVDGGKSDDLTSLQSSIKDGDLLVIDGEDEILLNVNVHLNNLTIVRSPGAVIAAKSIENFYAINNSVSAISGDITNAYVYDACLCNFNNNVTNLELSSTQNVDLAATIAVAGTVNHLKAAGKEFVHFEFYNFAENTLFIEAGHLITDASKYSEAPQAVTTPAPTTPSAPAGEYDDVPKTGGFSISLLWFIGMAVLCFAGHRKLKEM